MVWGFVPVSVVSSFPLPLAFFRYLGLRSSVRTKSNSRATDRKLPLTEFYRCATQPLAGKTYILFSKKAVYLIYLAIFEIGSLLCALAPTSIVLVVGRAISGLGASGMFAGGFAVQAAIIPLHKRAIWIGAISSTFAIASIVGPVIGGALTQVCIGHETFIRTHFYD